MGRGAIITGSQKQKLNTRSSTEAEPVGVDDFIAKMLSTKLLLEEQGHEITKNVLHQDNKSAILLETNGKKSSGKRTRALWYVMFVLAATETDCGASGASCSSAILCTALKAVESFRVVVDETL